MFGGLDVWRFGCLEVWMFGCLEVWMFGGLEVIRSTLYNYLQYLTIIKNNSKPIPQ
jgi:hypothetical protein